MTNNQALAAKLSLAFLWIFTGLTSIFFASQIGYQILESAGMNGSLADVYVISGAFADVVIGVWVLTNKYQQPCFYAQDGIILTFTALLRSG